MEAYDNAVEHALERGDDPQKYLDWKTGKGVQLCGECEHDEALHAGRHGCQFEDDKWIDGGNASGWVAGPCGCKAVNEFQALLARTWNALQKGAVAVALLLVLAGVSRADSLTEAQIAAQLEQGAIPLAAGVGDELALNLLDAQAANISYTANEPDSLQLSINAVLKAIGIYVWPGGPTLITDQQSEPIVWDQSNTAVDTGAAVTLSPTSIDFGQVPVTTPEPSILILCATGIFWAWAASRKPRT